MKPPDASTRAENTVRAYLCPDCGAIREETGGQAYECSECGLTYGRESAGSNRCPDCGSFGHKIDTQACADCEAVPEGGLQEIDAVECQACDALVAAEDYPGHYTPEHVQQEEARAAERARLAEAKQAAKAAEQERLRDQIGRRPLVVTINMQARYGEHVIRGNGVDAGSIWDERDGEEGFNAVRGFWWGFFERTHYNGAEELFRVHALPSGCRPDTKGWNHGDAPFPGFPTLEAAVADLSAWLKANIPDVVIQPVGEAGAVEE